MAKLDKTLSEPSILVKPVSRFGGLDNIHIALIVLAVILVLLIIIMSYTTKISIVNVTQGQNCTYGSVNGTCIHPVHTAAQAKMAAEQILAGYSTSNSAISLLPYLANVNKANVSYLSNTKQWYVSIPYTSPINGKSYLFGMLMSDANTSIYSTFVQETANSSSTDNYVVAPGVIKIAGETSCSAGGPLQVYWFIDPYAPGSIPSLINATRLQNMAGAKANVTMKILFTQYSQQVANTYGLNSTLNLGRYILCGSVQKNFTGFVKALNASYTGTYMPAYILQGIASASGFNTTSLNSCLSSSQNIMNVQAIQAKRFNITSSSAVVTDCQYISIPQTAAAAACYANSALC